MTQRSIEVLIGRLITDEAFRKTFRNEPLAAIGTFMHAGHDLAAVEISAITATPIDLWELAAAQIDSRLQKVSFDPTRLS